ncbi:MAG: hypothetical protein KJO79_02830 [Verrucomicrobiae bacterium]|nr:hypothetical protein [Verrucomicrobiae bacterium]NNJ86090.1 hypothetical protein [Akkermansiaceae bacterium]
MNPTDVMPIDEAQIHLLFEEAGLIQAENIDHAPDMRRVDAVIERAIHESLIKDTTSFVFKGFPAAIVGVMSVATGCVRDSGTDYRV